jgi:hypothetical protein
MYKIAIHTYKRHRMLNKKLILSYSKCDTDKPFYNNVKMIIKTN